VAHPCCSLLAGEERGTSPLEGKLTDEAIAEHVTGEKLPPTVPFNDKNSPKIFGAGEPPALRSCSAAPPQTMAAGTRARCAQQAERGSVPQPACNNGGKWCPCPAGIDRQLLLVAKATDLKSDAAVFKAFRWAEHPCASWHGMQGLLLRSVPSRGGAATLPALRWLHPQHAATTRLQGRGPRLQGQAGVCDCGRRRRLQGPSHELLRAAGAALLGSSGPVLGLSRGSLIDRCVCVHAASLGSAAKWLGVPRGKLPAVDRCPQEADTPVLVGFFMGGNKKYKLKEAIRHVVVCTLQQQNMRRQAEQRAGCGGGGGGAAPRGGPGSTRA